MERQLDAKLFLDEIPKWEPGGLHCLLLYKKMFKHALFDSKYNNRVAKTATTNRLAVEKKHFSLRGGEATRCQAVPG